MPVFAYKGLDGRGKNVKGMMDAEGHRELKAQLKKKGVFLVEYREDAKSGGSSKTVRRGSGDRKQSDDSGILSKEVDFAAAFKRVKLLEVAEVTRHLATLVRASIPIVDALGAVIEQVENPKLKSVLAEVRRTVMEGAALADALQQFPAVFSRLYINMVRAGESSGNLETVFERLAEFIEGQVRLRSKIVAALTYPAVMAVVGVGVVIMMMVVVVPKLSDMFIQMGVELPLPTRILIATAGFVSEGWWFLIIMFGVGIWLFRKWIKTPTGRNKWDRFSLAAPVFGKLNREIGLSRFCRTLGTLLSSGVPLLDSLEIVKAILGNSILEEVIERAQVEVREGQALAAPLKASGEFPPMVAQMISMGEKSGQLEEMLIHAAEAYEVQVESKLQTLTSLLEPLMILIMGGFVSLLVMSILMPLLRMNEAFNSM